jgi:hypothetical protein
VGLTRTLTALTVIALCTFAGWTGYGVVSFVAARAALRPGIDAAAAMRPWIGRAGVAGAARETALSEAIDPTDAAAVRRRADGLTAVLSVRPLSSATWLSLAGMWLVAGEPFSNVVRALEMSWLTGPNEGPLMLQRGIFGLLQWEILPPEARERIVADLAGALRETTVQDGEIAPAHSVLSSKTEQTREDIAEQLRASGIPARELARMGL